MGIAILNHPLSTNYPTFWMTRGYGLFGANPLGQYVYQEYHGVENLKEYKLALKKGESALFKFRIIIYEGSGTKERFDREFKNYTKQ